MALEIILTGVSIAAGIAYIVLMFVGYIADIFYFFLLFTLNILILLLSRNGLYGLTGNLVLLS